MNLLVTGISGRLGQALVEALMSNNPFDRVFGIDHTAPRILGPVVFIGADLRSVDVGDLLVMNDVQVVVHLACSRESAGLDVDAEIVSSILTAAQNAGVTRVVIPSRDWVYAPSAEACCEDAPLRRPRASRFFLQAARTRLGSRLGWVSVERKLLVEHAVERFRENCPEVRVVIPRMCSVIGPSRGHWIDMILSSPWLFSPSDAPPATMQFLHIEDAARVLMDCATKDGLDGPYNFAGNEPLSLDVIAGVLESRFVRLPRLVLHPLISGLGRMGLLSFRLSELISLQMSVPMCTDRAHRAVGSPRLSTRQALALWRVGRRFASLSLDAADGHQE